jgi:hypothetical protein
MKSMGPTLEILSATCPFIRRKSTRLGRSKAAAVVAASETVDQPRFEKIYVLNVAQPQAW